MTLEHDLEGIIEDGEHGPTLVGSRCHSCNESSFPPREFCPTCGGEELTRLQFNRSATLETYTIIHVPQEGFDAPYPVGFARLSPGNIRVFGPIEAEQDALSIGRTVHPAVLMPEQTAVPRRMWGFTVANGDT